MDFTPLGVDAYSRFQSRLFDERDHIGIPTGFQGMFGRPGSQTVFSPDALTVDIDIIRGNERIAKAIHRGTNARPLGDQENMNQQKYTNQVRVYPLIEEEGDISAHQVNFRGAGEHPYSGKTKTDRLRMLGFDLHKESIRRILRLFETLAAQSMLDGVQDAISGTTNDDYIYDFHRKATHTFTVSPLWDGVTPTIVADFDDACDLIREDGHVNPDIAVLGSTAMSSFINDTSVQATADNRRYELIQVSNNNPVPPQFKFMVDGGFIPMGRLRTNRGYELWMFTYIDVFTNDAGAATKYMPASKVLIFASQARYDRYFGPSEVLPPDPARAAFMQSMFGFNPTLPIAPPMVKNPGHVVRPGMFYFDAYPSADGKTVSVRTQSAPIFPTTMTDSIVTMTVTS